MKIYLLFFLLFLSYQTIVAQDRVPGELLIQSKQDNLLLPQQMISKYLRLEVLSERLRIYKVRYDTRAFDEESLFKSLKSNPDILHVQYNHIISYRDQIPNDPDYIFQQANLDRIQASKAWDLSTGGVTAKGDTIVIAIIDSGCDVFHEDLKENIWTNQGEIPNDGIDNDDNGYIDDFYGWNYFSQDDNHLANLNGSRHGTKVNGIIGAKGDNEQGVSGINWSVKLMNLSSTSTEDEVVQAYCYILDMRLKYKASNGQEGAYVVATNASFGVNMGQPQDFPIWCGIYDSLGEAGILSVAATINSPIDVDVVGDIPTACWSKYLISVTNVNQQDELLTAGWGKNTIDIGAPGEGTYSTDIQSGYASFGGTSGAAPMVTATIALIHALPCEKLAEEALEYPDRVALEIKESILSSVQRLPALEDRIHSEGMLDVYEAMFHSLDRYCFNYDDALDIVNIYPNPVVRGGALNLEMSLPDIESFVVSIYNSLGQQVYWFNMNPRYPRRIIYIDSGRFAAGVYFIKLSKNKGDKQVFKFVVL